MSRIDDLAAAIENANRSYTAGLPTISDREYDALCDELAALAPDHPELRKVGAPAWGEKVWHEVPMLSLAKTYDIDGVLKWAAGTKGPWWVQPKYDGVACSVRYDARGELEYVATRGDGAEGENVTAHALWVGESRGILRLGPCEEVRGELVMRRAVFDEHFAATFANPRNLVAGALGAKVPDGRVLSRVDFVAYDFQDASGVPGGTDVCGTLDLLRGVVEAAVRAAPDLPYETDGVVVKCAQPDERERLGATEHHPRWAIALKFQGETGKATYRKTEWQVSRTGTITPVVVFDPVQLSGVSIERATAHTFQRWLAFDLVPGDTLTITRRGGVIPHVESSAPIARSRDVARSPRPEFCPSCNKATAVDGEFLVCRNEHCEEQQVQRCVHYAKTVGMLGWGAEFVRKAELVSPVGFYTLTANTLVGLGFGKKQATKLCDEVTDARVLEPEMFLAALGMEHLGRSTVKKLLTATGGLKALRAARVTDLMEVEGVGRTMANVIWFELIDNSPLIDALLKEGVKITTPELGVVDSAKRPLAGKSFVFTGPLSDRSREDAQDEVCSLGGTTPKGVTRDLTYLVVGDLARGNQTGKRDKALRYNASGKAKIKLIDEVEFAAIVAAAHNAAGEE